MFYLGRSYMLNKQNLNVFKIGSLAVVLGALGLFGSSALAADACHNQNNALGSSETHKYTCEVKTDTHCPDGFDDTRYGQLWCWNGLECHRCMPSATPATTTAAGNGEVVTTTSTTTTSAAGNGLQCKEGFIPNAGWTDCVAKPATPAAWLTEEEKCRAQWSAFQWNNNKCESCSAPGVCCGVKLNTNVPFIGNCIRLWTDASTEDTTVVTDVTAFPRLMWGLTKILTTIILLVCFWWILVWGVMIAAAGSDEGQAKKGKWLIGKVILAMALLWTSGIILHLINPNFFW